MRRGRERGLHLRVRRPPVELADVERRAPGRRRVGGAATARPALPLRRRHVLSRHGRKRPRRLWLALWGGRGRGQGFRRRETVRRLGWELDGAAGGWGFGRRCRSRRRGERQQGDEADVDVTVEVVVVLASGGG